MKAEARSAAVVGKVVDVSEVPRGTVEVREVVAALGPVHDSQYGWRMYLGDADSQGVDAGGEGTPLVVLHAVVNKLTRVAWAREGG